MSIDNKWKRKKKLNLWGKCAVYDCNTRTFAGTVKGERTSTSDVFNLDEDGDLVLTRRRSKLYTW